MIFNTEKCGVLLAPPVLDNLELFIPEVMAKAEEVFKRNGNPGRPAVPTRPKLLLKELPIDRIGQHIQRVTQVQLRTQGPSLEFELLFFLRTLRWSNLLKVSQLNFA